MPDSSIELIIFMISFKENTNVVVLDPKIFFSKAASVAKAAALLFLQLEKNIVCSSFRVHYFKKIKQKVYFLL